MKSLCGLPTIVWKIGHVRSVSRLAFRFVLGTAGDGERELQNDRPLHIVLALSTQSCDEV